MPSRVMAVTAIEQENSYLLVEKNLFAFKQIPTARP
jgi:hypothetical protein